MSQPIPAVRAEESDRKRASLSSAGRSTPARSSASEKSCRPSDPAADTSTWFTAQHYPGYGNSISGTHGGRARTAIRCKGPDPGVCLIVRFDRTDRGNAGARSTLGACSCPIGGIFSFFFGRKKWKTMELVYYCIVPHRAWFSRHDRRKVLDEETKKGASGPQQYYV